MFRALGPPLWATAGEARGAACSLTASAPPPAVCTVRSICAPSGVVATRSRRQRAGPVPGEVSAVGTGEKPGQQVRLRAADLDGVRLPGADPAVMAGVGGLQPGRQGGQPTL